MPRLAGRLLIATGIGHALVGVAVFHESLAAIARDCCINAVEPGVWHTGITPHLGREAAFWFLLFSPILFMLGQVVHRASARQDIAILRVIGWNLVAVGAAGALLMPLSGFWIVIALGTLVLHEARQAETVGSFAGAGQHSEAEA